MFDSGVGGLSILRALRAVQFPEDAGPMAHPIRPESFIEISNFYTATVYEKGAEVVRMIHTLIGAEKFRKGMDLYFQRHDGQAVTCDDFAQAMGARYLPMPHAQAQRMADVMQSLTTPAQA